MPNEFIDLLSPNSIIYVTAPEKVEVIKELVNNIITVNKLRVGSDKLIEEFMKREQRGSTGLQNGIAVPHIKTDVVKHFYLSIGVHRQGIDFKSLDGKSTQVIFLLIAPLNQSHVHLKFLSMVSRLFLKKDFYQEVLAFNNTEDLCKFFKTTFAG